MHKQLLKLSRYVPSQGKLSDRVTLFLMKNDCRETALHVTAVAGIARHLAGRFRVDPGQAESAGWLHDLGRVYSKAKMLEAAKELGMEIVTEEEKYPGLLHQKLSAVIARHLFQIDDEEILTAVNCHTTLRAGASALDKVLFISDKLSWTDQNALPCKDHVLSALDDSLDEAVLIYIQWVMEDNSSSKVIHPWFSEAKDDLWEKKM